MHRLGKHVWLVVLVLSTVTLVGCQQGGVPVVLGRLPDQLAHNYHALDPQGDFSGVDLHPHQEVEPDRRGVGVGR